MRLVIPVLVTLTVIGFLVGAFLGARYYLKVDHVNSIVTRMSEVYGVPKDVISGELLFYEAHSSFQSSSVKITFGNNFSLDSLKKFCDSENKLEMTSYNKLSRGPGLLGKSESYLTGLLKQHSPACIGSEYDPDYGSDFYEWFIMPGKTYIWVGIG